MRGYDIFGNIAVLKFKRGEKLESKKRKALEVLKNNKSVNTVVEKVDKFKGRLRTFKTKHLTGEKTLEVLYRENGCVFRFNLETCYFSPRLSNERLNIARLVKKNEEVLVLFAGVGPFPIVISKFAKPKRIAMIELGRDCCKYAIENAKRNKVNMEVIQGDVRKKLPKIKDKFDRIVMARPNLKDSFLDVTFPRIKKNGIIHYYGFYPEDEVDKMKEMILDEAKKSKRKIKILKIEKAGDIGVKRFRYRVDIKVLN